MTTEIVRKQLEQSFKELKKEVVALQRKEARLAKSLSDLERTTTDSVRKLEGDVERLRQEITDRDQKQRTLEQSERRLRAMIKQMDYPLAVYDREGKMLVMNESGARSIEGSPEDFVGKSILDLFPEKGEVYLERINKGFRTGASEEYADEVSLPSGERWFSSVYQPVADVDDEIFAVQIMSVDITLWKKVEKALRESEKKYRELYDEAPMGYHELDSDGCITQVNHRELEMLGYTAEEMKGRPVWDFVVEEDAQESIMGKLSSERPVSKSRERTYRRKDGRTLPVLVNDKIVMNSEGRITGIRSTIQDITERKQAEECSRQNQTKYMELFEVGADAICLVDNASGRLLEVNSAATDMYGYTREELLTMRNTDLSAEPEDTHRVTTSTPLGKAFVPLRYHRRKDGTVFPVEISGRFFVWQGRAVHVAAIRDITERRRAEETLQALVTRQEALLAAIPDIIMETNPNKIYTWANQAGFDFFGETVIGRPASYYFEGEQDTYDAVKPLFNGDESVIYLESWQRRKDGEKRLLAWWCRVLKDGAGNVRGALSSASDITECKRAEEALRESEARFSTTFQSSPFAIAISRLDNSVLTDVNKAWQKVSGFTPKEALGHTPIELKTWVNPSDQERLISVLREQGKVQDFECQVRHKSGSVSDMLMSAELIDLAGARYMLSLAQDITSRKQTEAALRENEQLLSQTFASMRDALFVVVTDKGGKPIIKGCNPAASEIFGYSREEMMDRSTDFLHVDGSALDEFREARRSAFQQKGYLSEFDFRMKRKDGTIFHTEHSIMPLKGNDGRQIGWVSIVRDVTDRKKAEEELRKSEEKYRFLVEHANDAIYVTQDGKIPFANPMAETITGYTVDELKETPIGQLIHPEDREMVLDQYRRRLKGEQPPNNYSLRLIRKAGEGRWGLINSVLIEWEERPATLNFMRDITEQKRAEVQLQQAQKMEAIGTLAAGLAHEINNPVNCILINAPLLERVWEDILPTAQDYAERNPEKTYGGLTFSFLKENLAQLISDIGLGADRIEKLVAALKNFARRTEEIKKEPVDINDAVENAIKLSRSTAEKSGIELHVQYGQNIPKMEGHIESLEQIFLNLVINSLQAIHRERGEIRITTDFQATTKKISILVEDNGEGIDPSVATKIFEPFFTTKQMEGGGGLGLFVTYNLVKKFNGDISFESRKGAGTVFKITFPVEKHEKMARILVVDDDEQIVSAVVEVLARHPLYMVEAASNGIEALIRMGTFKPDVLILDIFMPGMDGVELCRKLRNEPSLSGLSVIIITGQINDPRVGELKKMGFKEIYEKPFAIEDIMNGVSEALIRKK